MKELYLFSLLLLIVIVGGAEDAIQYHGERRYYTVEHDGHTNVALHILKEQTNPKVKLLFPKEGKSFHQILSDIKLSSLSSNVKCEDGHEMKFKLIIDGQSDIHGTIKGEKLGQIDTAMMYLYEKCLGVERVAHYAIGRIDDRVLELESNGRICFENSDATFQTLGPKNEEKFVELQVLGGNFKCQTFMILPPYMHVEDVVLPTSKRPLNATLAAQNSDEKYWWKNTNDPWLPDGISFDSGNNVLINVLNITEESSYFFRIGVGQPIPTFKFNLGRKCNGAQLEFYLNLKTECRVHLLLGATGYKVSTSTAVNEDISDPAHSPTLIFGGNRVYVKVQSPLLIRSFAICDLTADPTVVDYDQFVLRILPLQAAGDCEKAQITVPKTDVPNGIEVLIDQSKIVENTTESLPSNVGNNSTTSLPRTTEKTAAAGIEWWWYLIIVILLVIIIGAAALIYFLWIRPCLKKRKQSKTSRNFLESIDYDEEARKMTEVKTALSPEQPAKEKKKEQKQRAKEDGEKLDAKKKKTTSSGATKENEKAAKVEPPSKPQPSADVSKQPSSKPTPNGALSEPPQKPAPPPTPIVQPAQVPKPAPVIHATEPTQDSATGTHSNKAPAKPAAPLQPPKPVLPLPAPPPPAPRKPLPPRKLKYRNMYGDDGFTKMDEPYDYHVDESPKFEPTKIPAEFNPGDTLVHANFWDCLAKIVPVRRFCGVFGFNYTGFNEYTNIYFMVRDLVDRDGYYGGLRTSLSNRVLEKFENDAPRIPQEPKYIIKNKKIVGKFVKYDWYFSMRVFVLSYDPLTIEIHCKGPWPHFVFNIFDCDDCKKLLDTLHENEWKNSPVTCCEDWETFVCRVKRTPINSHQFLTYYGDLRASEPADPNDIYHVLVIRGDCEAERLRECARGCYFTDMSHPNGFKLQTPLAKPPSTAATAESIQN